MHEGLIPEMDIDFEKAGRACIFDVMHVCVCVQARRRHSLFVLVDELFSPLAVKACREQVLKHTEHLMRTKGHAVIVVAEGCGDTLIKSSGDTDAGRVRQGFSQPH